MTRARLCCVMAALGFLLLSAPALGQDGVDVEDDEYADEEKAFLIARKYVDADELVVGKNVTVVIELYNAGTSSAFEVVVDDGDNVAGDGFEVSGSSKGQFDKIPAGASVRHQYSVIPKAAGSVSAAPARITYKAEPDAPKPQVVYSTTVAMSVLSTKDKLVNFALKLGRYVSFGHLTTVSGWRNASLVLLLLTVLLSANYGYSSITAQRKRSKYQRALEEVEKMK